MTHEKHDGVRKDVPSESEVLRFIAEALKTKRTVWVRIGTDWCEATIHDSDPRIKRVRLSVLMPDGAIVPASKSWRELFQEQDAHVAEQMQRTDAAIDPLPDTPRVIDASIDEAPPTERVVPADQTIAAQDASRIFPDPIVSIGEGDAQIDPAIVLVEQWVRDQRPLKVFLRGRAEPVIGNVMRVFDSGRALVRVGHTHKTLPVALLVKWQGMSRREE
jgi:hypothetical protein